MAAKEVEGVSPHSLHASYSHLCRYLTQELDVNLICEGDGGYPAVVQMEPAGKLTYKFSAKDYIGIVRELVQGLVSKQAYGAKEWEGDEAWKSLKFRRNK